MVSPHLHFQAKINWTPGLLNQILLATIEINKFKAKLEDLICSLYPKTCFFVCFRKRQIIAGIYSNYINNHICMINYFQRGTVILSPFLTCWPKTSLLLLFPISAKPPGERTVKIRWSISKNLLYDGHFCQVGITKHWWFTSWSGVDMVLFGHLTTAF